MSRNLDSEILVLHDSLSDDSDQDRRRMRKKKFAYSVMVALGFLFMIGVAVVAFYAIKFGIFNSHNDIRRHIHDRLMCSKVHDLEKLDCFPDAKHSVSKEKCEERGCCYKESNVQNSNPKMNVSWFPPLGVPYCFYPADYLGYSLKNIKVDERTYSASLERDTPSGFPDDIKKLSLLVSKISEDTIEIKINDPNNKRFEVPVIKKPVPKKKFDGESLYNINLTENGVLTIERKSSGIIIFNTNLSRLVFADQFLQISTRLPTSNIYGIGEHYDHLRRNVNWTRTIVFNRDNFPSTDINLYGTQPLYLSLEEDGSSHGVFFLNSNSMDFILQPTPALTYRTIGGILDIFIFLGPSSAKVVQQYTGIVGRPFMPPYWSLGFHLCRYGYYSVEKTKAVWERTRNASIPFDTQWNDIDYMDRYNDFSYDREHFAGLPDFVNELHAAGMHYVVITDPGVSNVENRSSYPPYDDGINTDVFIKNSSGGIYVGKVWNEVSTVFPDFSHPNGTSYWTQQFQKFHDEIKFDGIWIDMNEPSNFISVYGCPNNSKLEDPPYTPGGLEPLSARTICVSAKHYNTTHYNEHNLYGFREAVATSIAIKNITGRRPFIISRATFAGQGFYSGHWSGDITSNWEDMRYSIIDLLNFNIFGMPMIGSDICGFAGNTTVELCARWSTLGAFYPFSRNHNDYDTIEQDPVALESVVVDAAKNSLIIRYQLLPYLYTLFYKSHMYGDTVARPLFFEFPNDTNTYSIEEQFLLGPAFMVMPALYPGMKNVTAYFPKGIWCDYNSSSIIRSSGEHFTLEAPLTQINLAVRGGHVLPLQISNATTTTEGRQANFTLFAVLDEDDMATGDLYWDDGDSLDSVEAKKYNLIEFSIKNNTLTTSAINDGFKVNMDVDLCKICALKSKPKEVTVNGKTAMFEFKDQCLYIYTDEMSLLQSNKVVWI